jgi:hypothetical protein
MSWQRIEKQMTRQEETQECVDPQRREERLDTDRPREIFITQSIKSSVTTERTFWVVLGTHGSCL